MARLKDARLLSVTLLFAILAAGFLMGMAWKSTQAATPSPEVEEARPERPSGERRLVIDEVGLEPEKRAEVEGIIQHFRVQMKALDEEFREAYEPRQRALFRGTRDSIKSILSDQQRAAYDSLLAARSERRDADRNRRRERENREGGGRGGR